VFPENFVLSRAFGTASHFTALHVSRSLVIEPPRSPMTGKHSIPASFLLHTSRVYFLFVFDKYRIFAQPNYFWEH